MQKHFSFVSTFEHLNFASNENIPITFTTIQIILPL